VSIAPVTLGGGAPLLPRRIELRLDELGRNGDLACAERLYARLGWTRVGVIPGYALYPDGRPCDTTVFWKAL